MTAPLSTEKLSQLIITALEDLKGKNIIELDVKPLTSMADRIIVASGTSTRHVKSLADNVVENCKKAGAQPLGVEGAEAAEWVLVDLNAIIVHVMLPATREYYDLERLWSVKPSRVKASEDKDAG